MTPLQDPLADLRHETTKRKSCQRCGATTTDRAQVQIAIRELGPQGQSNGGRAVASRARSLCPACAAEAYVRVRDMLDTFIAENSDGQHA